MAPPRLAMRILLFANVLLSLGWCMPTLGADPQAAQQAAKPLHKAAVPGVFDTITCTDGASAAGKKAGQWITIASDGGFRAHSPADGPRDGQLTADELTELRKLIRAVEWKTVKKDYRLTDGELALRKLSLVVGNRTHETSVGDRAASPRAPLALKSLLAYVEDLFGRHVGAVTVAANPPDEQTEKKSTAGKDAAKKTAGSTASTASAGTSSLSGGRTGSGTASGSGYWWSPGGPGRYPTFPGPGLVPGGDPSKPLAILFIGNSYTSVNELPRLVAGLAQAGGRKVEVAQVTPGGCTLEQHVQTSGAMQQIRSRKWDVVVLQEQSMLPVVDPEKMYKAARILHAEIQKQGAQTVFFLTWARQNMPEMQDGLNKAYFGIAKELGATVAPVGIAWRQALAADPKLVLHNPDKSHPNAQGSYLAACVLYATLLGKSPEGLPSEVKHNGQTLLRIDPAVARELQGVAAKAMSGGK